MMSTWRKKKGRSHNSWRREVITGKREGNYQHEMDRQGRMEKKYKTVGTERRENIDFLCKDED